MTAAAASFLQQASKTAGLPDGRSVTIVRTTSADGRSTHWQAQMGDGLRSSPRRTSCRLALRNVGVIRTRRGTFDVAPLAQRRQLTPSTGTAGSD